MNPEIKKSKKASLMDGSSMTKGMPKIDDTKSKHQKSNSNVEFAFNEKEKESNHLKEKLSNFMSNYDGKNL